VRASCTALASLAWNISRKGGHWRTRARLRKFPTAGSVISSHSIAKVIVESIHAGNCLLNLFLSMHLVFVCNSLEVRARDISHLLGKVLLGLRREQGKLGHGGFDFCFGCFSLRVQLIEGQGGAWSVLNASPRMLGVLARVVTGV